MVPVKHATEQEQGQKGDQKKEKEHSRLSLIQHRAINKEKKREVVFVNDDCLF